MKLALAVTTLALMIAVETFACTPMPLSMRNEFFNDALAQSLSKEGVRILDVKLLSTTYNNPRVVKYEWVKTDPAFMCHDRETLETSVEVSYEKNNGKTACVLVAKFTKTESYWADAPKTVYTVDTVRHDCE
jgi:hypothetical protein